MVNKVTLIGRVGGDPEVKRLESGVAVAKFSLATSDSYKDKEGNKIEQTEWHKLVIWRGMAEVAEKYVRKGMLVYVEGKITYREYTDKDNQKKHFTEIVVDSLRMVDSPNRSSAGEHQTPTTGGALPTEPTAVPMGAGMGQNPPSDDLPF